MSNCITLPVIYRLTHYAVCSVRDPSVCMCVVVAHTKRMGMPSEHLDDNCMFNYAQLEYEENTLTFFIKKALPIDLMTDF